MNKETTETKPDSPKSRTDEVDLSAATCSALREQLSAIAHEQWSGWMEYLFSKCVNPVEPDTGTVVIPKWAVDRWTRQMKTPYSQLPEDEKESDRMEADRAIEVFKQNVKADPDLT